MLYFHKLNTLSVMSLSRRLFYKQDLKIDNGDEVKYKREKSIWVRRENKIREIKYFFCKKGNWLILGGTIQKGKWLAEMKRIYNSRIQRAMYSFKYFDGTHLHIL